MLKKNSIRYKIALFTIILTLGIIILNYGLNHYNVTVNEYGNHGMQVQKKDKVDFALSIIEEYQNNVKKETHDKFQEKFSLADNCSVLYVISNFGESILFIYPSPKKEISINYVNVPAQVMLTHGLIDLNNPHSAIHPEHIQVNVPEKNAIEYYKSSHSNLQSSGRGSSYLTGEGEGAVAFNNPFKIVEFVDNDSGSFMTFYGGKFNVETSDPMTLSIYKRSMKFSYNLKGPLIVTNATDFTGLSDIGREIGVTLFNKDYKELIIKSETFKYFLGHKKIKPIAEEIALKKKRSEEDKSFDYPLWMFKEDLLKLQELSIKEGISKEYVDELVGMMKSSSMTGTLLYYYIDKNGFILQWLLINASLMLIMISISIIKINGTPIVQLLLNGLTAIQADKYLLTVIIVAVNSWVFTVKPPHLDVRYWLIPALLIFTNVAVSIYIQKTIIR